MKKSLISICILLAAVSAANAQEFSTTYFLDNNIYSYRINPAIPAEKGFVGLAVGNINVSAASSLGLNSILYPNGSGGLVTGFHSSVSAGQFLGNLPESVDVTENLNMNFLSVGFWAKNAFHSIEFNIREDVYAGLPKDIFELFKLGSRDIPYDLTNTAVNAKSYAELSYGYSRRIGEKFSFGGRVKLLAGLASADVAFNKGAVSVNGNNVAYDLDAKLRLSSGFLKLGTKSEAPDTYDFSEFEFDQTNLSPSGWGGAVDLGLTYKPNRNLTLSYSVTDLGGIAWNYGLLGHSSGSDSFSGETIKSDGTLKGDFEKFIDGFESLADFKKIEGEESSFDMLACTMHLGARYNMPFYDRLSVGLLASYRIDKYAPSLEARLGATVTPIDWFSITGNYGINTYGRTFGAALSLNLLNLNFVLGYEGYSGKTGKVSFSEGAEPVAVPLGSFMEMVKLGVNITFGKRHNTFKPLKKSATETASE